MMVANPRRWLTVNLATSLLRIVLIAATAASLVTAQRRPVGTRAGYTFDDRNGRLSIDPHSRPSLTWVEERRGRIDVLATGYLPFDLPGQPLYVGARTFLIPGVDARTGDASILEARLDATTRSIVVGDRRSFGNAIDPHSLFWNRDERLLYLQDCSRRELQIAPFDGTSLPEVFIELPASRTAPEFRAAWYSLRLFAAPGVPTGVCIEDTESRSSFTHVHRDDSGRWVADLRAMGAATSTRLIDMEQRESLNALGPLRVSGVTGTVTIEQRSPVPRTLTRTEVRNPEGYSSLELPRGGLLPGMEYEIVAPAAKPLDGYTSMIQAVLARRGVPQVAAPLTMRRGTIPGAMCTGDPGFTIRGAIRGDPAELPLTVDAYLVLSVRDVDGTDPVQNSGAGRCFLKEVHAIAGPFPMTLSPSQEEQSLRLTLPIPDDDALQGSVLLMQWGAIAGNGTAVLSDVFGAMITPRWRHATTEAQERIASWLDTTWATYPRLREGSVAALRDWLARQAQWSVDGERLAAWRSIAGR